MDWLNGLQVNEISEWFIKSVVKHLCLNIEYESQSTCIIYILYA